MSQLLMDGIDPDFPLHWCAFHNSDKIGTLIKSYTKEQLDKQDKYGNTALHIALMLKNEACSKSLLDAGCSVDIRNLEGWRQIDEITALGKVSMAFTGFKIFHDQKIAKSNSAAMSESLSSVPDCKIKFEWEFKSWIPFLAHHLPSDSCTLFKKHNKIRLDTTLLDFKNRSWVRGQLSIIFDASKPFSERICVVDHKRRMFQILDGTMAQEENGEWLERTVNTSLHMPVVRMRADFDSINFREQKSKLIWNKEAAIEKKIGQYWAKLYTLSNVKVTVKKRTEHLSRDEVKYFATLNAQIKSGMFSNAVQTAQTHVTSEDEKLLREEFGAPLEPRVSWETYNKGELVGLDRYLGTKPQIKDQVKELKLFVGITEEVDFDLSCVMALLKCFSPLEKFTKLNKSFVSGLPPGFPIRIDLPFFPGVTGRLTFSSILRCNAKENSNTPALEIKDDLFEIPYGYTMSDVLESI